YLLDEEEGRFERAHLLGHGQFPESAAPTLPLLVELERERRLFFLDEVGRQPGGPDPMAMREGFARLGSEVLAPLVDSDRVIGFLGVGPKRSGDPFYSDDADLLATLANQSAVAVRNAQVHHQVLLVNEHIQRILATIESGGVGGGLSGGGGAGPDPALQPCRRGPGRRVGPGSPRSAGRPPARSAGPPARVHRSGWGITLAGRDRAAALGRAARPADVLHLASGWGAGGAPWRGGGIQRPQPPQG